MGQFLTRLQNLKSLNLHFSSCLSIDSEMLVSLGENLQKVSGLQHLNITFEFCKAIRKVGLRKLQEMICAISSLKSSKIVLKNPPRGFLTCPKQLESLKNIAFELSSQKSAPKVQACVDKDYLEESLDLRFEKSIAMTGELDQALETCMTNWKKLNNLSLDLSFGEMVRQHFHNSYNLPNRENDIFYLRQILHVPTNPQDKKLDSFSELKKALDKSLLDKDSTKSNKNLKKFYLNLSNSNLLEPYLAFPIKQIERMASLRVLNVDLSSCVHLAFEGFRIFFGTSQKLSRLRSLTINFSNTGDHWKQLKEKFDNQLDKLFESLNHIKETVAQKKDPKSSKCLSMLTNIVDCFARFRSRMTMKTQENMLHYLHIIEQITGFSERLRIAFPPPKGHFETENSWKNEISYGTRAVLDSKYEGHTKEDMLAEIKRLMGLKDSFLKEEIVDENLGFKSLEKLNLNFEKNATFDDEELQYLSEVIKRTSSLRHIDLNFSNCQKITMTGFEQLAEALKSLKKLKSLSLNVSGCPNITSYCLEALETDLKHILSFQLTRSE